MVQIGLTLAIIATGTASQYAPGVMDRVIANRQAGITAMDLPLKLPPVDGYIAVLNCADIGKIVLLKPTGSDKWERFLITDCAGKRDGGYSWMLRSNIIVEVDYETAKRWDTVGYGIKCQMAQLRKVRYV